VTQPETEKCSTCPRTYVVRDLDDHRCGVCKTRARRKGLGLPAWEPNGGVSRGDSEGYDKRKQDEVKVR
jgi:hypothetical protein